MINFPSFKNKTVINKYPTYANCVWIRTDSVKRMLYSTGIKVQSGWIKIEFRQSEVKFRKTPIGTFRYN